MDTHHTLDAKVFLSFYCSVIAGKIKAWLGISPYGQVMWSIRKEGMGAAGEELMARRRSAGNGPNESGRPAEPQNRRQASFNFNQLLHPGYLPFTALQKQAPICLGCSGHSSLFPSNESRIKSRGFSCGIFVFFFTQNNIFLFQSIQRFQGTLNRRSWLSPNTFGEVCKSTETRIFLTTFIPPSGKRLSPALGG